MDGLWRGDPWTVDPAAFPTGDSTARLRFLVTYATLAPSGHNTQPWRFLLRPDAVLDLRADRQRTLPVVDPTDRALTIACGAALANLRIAAAALGEAVEVALLPNLADPDLLARVTARGACTPTITGPRLLRAMTARRTSRFAYAPDAVPVLLRDEAITAATRAGTAELAWLDTHAARHEVALLIAEGDRLQMADPAFRHELATWMRPRHGASRDGLSGAAFGLPDLLSSAAALVVRTFDMGAGQAARDRALAEGSPALAVLATPGDAAPDWLEAGEALQRLLLALTAGGFTASFLNQPIEVAALRPRLAIAAGVAGLPQILLRIGRGPKPVPAARRPVQEVLVEAR